MSNEDSHLLQAGMAAALDARLDGVQAQLRVREPARLLGRLLPRHVDDCDPDAVLLDAVRARQALRMRNRGS